MLIGLSTALTLLEWAVMRRIAHALFGMAVFMLAACQGPKTKECLRQVGEASHASKELDAKSTSSVESDLKVVESAIDACKTADRDDEVAQLEKARVALKAHLERLRKAEEPANQPISDEQLAELVAKGDPHCPKGQAYKHAGKEVRCTGPQLVDMTYGEAHDYLERHDFKLTDVPPSSLKAEHGAELFVFEFERPKDEEPARCVTIYPPPEQSWQEAVARASGARPGRLESGSSITTKRGKMALRVEGDASTGPIHIGDCKP
jgi:hypothetical protein